MIGKTEYFVISLTPSLAGSTQQFFFFNDPATTEIYTLSLHDALPIWRHAPARRQSAQDVGLRRPQDATARSEEHTSELQSHLNLVCRLLLEKKKEARSTIAFIDVAKDHAYL